MSSKSTTQLDRQLSKINERAHRVDTNKYRDSLLFDAKEAAAIDYEAVLVIGQEGLRELIRLDQRFKEFESNLFAPSSRSHNRMQITAEESDQLDTDIHRFLRLSSGYFLLNPAQKALEWLIRRYRINEFNIDSLMISVIPYHQSNTFAKLVSILRFSRDGKWSFLSETKKNKVSITRDFFVKLMKKNGFFSELICNAIIEYENNATLSKTMVSFFTALLIDLVSSSNSVPEHFNRVALPCLNYCLKSSNIELQLGAFMILSNIASKVQFSNEAIELLIRSTLKNCQGSLMASFTFLLVLFQKQKIESQLSVTTLEMLVDTPALGDILLELHQQNRSLDQFMAVTLKYLLDTYSEKAESFDLLLLYVTELPSTQMQRTTIVSTLLKQYLVLNSNTSSNGAASSTSAAAAASSAAADSSKEQVLDLDLMRKLIRAVDPALVQTVINACTEGDQARLTEFQSLIFAQKFLSKSKANELFLRLVSPAVQSRLEGVRQLESLQSSGTNIDWRSFSDSVCALLVDSDHTVVQQTWSLTNLNNIVQLDQLIESMQRCIATPSLSQPIKQQIVERMSIEFLKQQQQSQQEDDKEEEQPQKQKQSQQEQQLFSTLSQFFLILQPDNGSHKWIVEYLSNKKHHSMFKGLKSDFHNIDIVSTLGENLLKNTELLHSLIEKAFTNIDDYSLLPNDKILLLLISSYTLPKLKNASDRIKLSNIILQFSINFLSLNNIKSAIRSIFTLDSLCQSIESDYHSLVVPALTLALTFDSLMVPIKDDAILLEQIKAFEQQDRSTDGAHEPMYLELLQQLFIASITMTSTNANLSTLLIQNFIEEEDEEEDKVNNNNSSSSSSSFENYLTNEVSQLEPEQYITLVHLISDYSSEFTMSGTFFKSFVGSVLMSRTTKTFSSKEREQIGSYLVSSAMALDTPTQRSALLAALSEIREPYVFNICNRYMEELLEKCQKSTVSIEETIVLDVLIEQLVQLPVLNSKKGHLPMLIKSLDINTVVQLSATQNYSVIQSIEKRLTHSLLVGLAYKDQTTLLEKLLDLLQSDEVAIRDSTLLCLGELLVDANSILSVLSVKSKNEKVLPTITRLNSLMDIIKNNAGKIKDIIEMIKITVSRDDNQTFSVLKRFLADTLPVLLEAGGITLTAVFRMFIKAFDDIPKQNRVELFSMMIQSINYSKLAVFLTLTMEKRIDLLRKETLLASSNENGMDLSDEKSNGKQSESAVFNEFVTAVANKVPAVPMSLALSILSQAVNTIALESATVDQDQEFANDQLEEIVKLFESSAAKDNRLIQANILDFIDERLSATTYLEDLSFRVNPEQRQQIEQFYLDAFSSLLVLLRGITESLESLKSDPAAKKGREKYLKKLLSSVNRCMDRYNQLLSIDGFVISVSKLLHHADPQVRRRSLVIFNEKITALKSKLTNEQILKFLSLLSDFAKIIESSNENDTNKQTALLSFEILARNFAIKHSSVFLRQMPTIINAMGSGSYMVVSSSLICIATLCSELQAKTVPHIPQFFPVLLNTLTGSYKSTEESESRSLLQLSCQEDLDTSHQEH
ncbi:U3 snoRNP protein [Heterostelium album PN500]|uniref:HEAT repeat-containing protein 1 n=1 Tax=Heterostelium pallidum (strain ATCC 26659 / Pp 5 / PN500) TaxID=670386 RepID=D3BAC5_HETP5|nr:U3 snoRNP protein [Heterostelium album PN500]EFA81512.1 U3 snoRNP protein [Heterostelium album PN500]|eukprot:XP_020433629.1 U3 snoRNP protein [Heterostelium album PN500]